MYEFYGNDFNSFIVNLDHILCLKTNNSIIEISVRDFLNIKNKDEYYLYNLDDKLLKFNFKRVNDDNYYGFEIDKNNRYVMGNGVITHNSNGKSKILELFVHSLGMYSIKFPITMLTGKRAASNACTPEIVQSKGKRFGYFEEPSENERINAGLLKEFTGGDKIKARGLHKDPIEFKPQFKLALLCNEMPEVPPNDSGTWRRMEVIEFKSRFCENPKETHEFPIDKNLSEKLKNWKELFMALLLDVYYAKYKKVGIKVPIEVIKFTLEYQKQCDLYTDFISENLEDIKNLNQSIDINQLYDEFKIWYEDTFSNHKYPSKIEFKRYLKKKYTTKRISQNELKGFKFRIKCETSNLSEIIPDNQKNIDEDMIEKIDDSIINPVNKPLINQNNLSNEEIQTMSGY
jgi:P4 family phage/plasmid primase-like protien